MGLIQAYFDKRFMKKFIPKVSRLFDSENEMRSSVGNTDEMEGKLQKLQWEISTDLARAKAIARRYGADCTFKKIPGAFVGGLITEHKALNEITLSSGRVIPENTIINALHLMKGASQNHFESSLIALVNPLTYLKFILSLPKITLEAIGLPTEKYLGKFLLIIAYLLYFFILNFGSTWALDFNAIKEGITNFQKMMDQFNAIGVG